MMQTELFYASLNTMLEAMTEDHQCSVLAVAAMTADTFTQSSPPALARLGWLLVSAQ